jgi:hypothetical protein
MSRRLRLKRRIVNSHRLPLDDPLQHPSTWLARRTSQMGSRLHVPNPAVRRFDGMATIRSHGFFPGSPKQQAEKVMSILEPRCRVRGRFGVKGRHYDLQTEDAAGSRLSSGARTGMAFQPVPHVLVFVGFVDVHHRRPSPGGAEPVRETPSFTCSPDVADAPRKPCPGFTTPFLCALIGATRTGMERLAVCALVLAARR